MVNLNSAENAHFMLWPDQFQKIHQIKAWYYRIDLTNQLRSYNGLNEAPNQLAQIILKKVNNGHKFLVMLLTENEFIGSPTEADA